MKRKLYLPLILAVMMIVSSCSKMGELSPELFTANPSPLEAVGGKVPVTIQGKFPEKYLKKNATVVVTPVLVYEGGEAKSASKSFQGEKVKGNNEVIEYKAGGTYTMSASFDYIPAMAKSELYLEFQVTDGKKEITIPRVKIADGVIATSELCDAANGKSSIAADKFQRIISDKYETDIKFLIQQANIRASELKKSELAQWQQNVKEAKADDRKEVKGIEISSYASPDGGMELNTKLAENREKSTINFMNKELKKMNAAINLDAKFTPEDWDGFAQLVSASTIQDKDLILNVLKMYTDPEQREQEIKNISAVYKQLADEILPQLRRSKLTAAYDIIGKSDDEIRAAFKENPSSLSIEEILYAGTLTQNVDEKLAIYTKASELYSSDFRTFNNVASCYFAKGNVAAAEQWVTKAAAINANAPEVNLNLGLVALSKKDVATAEKHFGKAAAAPEVKSALGMLYVKKGEYAKAVNAYGDCKCNEAALAQILTKDYNKAQNTLKAVAQPTALTSYLKAIVGARTNNADAVKTNLADAVAKDASYKAKAQKDIEFAKYQNAIPN